MVQFFLVFVSLILIIKTTLFRIGYKLGCLDNNRNLRLVQAGTQSD